MSQSFRFGVVRAMDAALPRGSSSREAAYVVVGLVGFAWALFGIGTLLVGPDLTGLSHWNVLWMPLVFPVAARIYDAYCGWERELEEAEEEAEQEERAEDLEARRAEALAARLTDAENAQMLELIKQIRLVDRGLSRHQRGEMPPLLRAYEKAAEKRFVPR